MFKIRKRSLNTSRTYVAAAVLGFILGVYLLDPNIVKSGLPARTTPAGSWETLRSSTSNYMASDTSSNDGRLLVLFRISVVGNWQYIVEDQVTKLMFSGLYSKLSSVHCTVSSSIPDGAAQVSKLLSGYGSKFLVAELPGAFSLLKSITTVSNLTSSDRVLFLSTYGASAAANIIDSEKAFQWRMFMEYEMIKSFPQRLEELQDRAFVGMDESPELSESGTTFWWATGQHLLQVSGTASVNFASIRSTLKFSKRYFKQQSEVSRRKYLNRIGSVDKLSPASYVDNASPVASPCFTGPPDEVPTPGGNASCKVVVFHHLYIDNNWREIIVDQLAKLIFTGVYDRAAAVYSTISGPDDSALTAAQHLLASYGSKFKILDRQINSTLYERLTLYQIKSHVSADDIILYIHSKGVSGGSKDIDRQVPGGRLRIWHWRNAMEYFLLAHHKFCIQLLDPLGQFPDKVDNVGINWDSNPPVNHYSGNFWWTTARHWATMPEWIDGSYNGPEMMLLKASPRAACIWDTGLKGMGHYNSDYYPREYSDVTNITVVERSEIRTDDG